MRLLLVWPLLAAALISPACSSAPEPATRTRKAPAGNLAQLVFENVNRERRGAGLPELRWHAAAAEAARKHSRAMAERSFFSHDDPTAGDLKKRLAALSVPWQSIGENIFRQRGQANPVTSAVRAWMESSGHRNNILSREFTHTGVGVSTAVSGELYYTQVFLTPPAGSR